MTKLIYAIVAIMAVVLGAMAFSVFTKLPTPEHALYYQQARQLKPFQLTDEKGQVFSNKNIQGQWSFVFLGYTSCPDVCPTTLQNLAFIYDELKAIANDSQVLLLSADPKRDTQDKLSQYIAYFNPEFKALRAEHDVLFAFTRNLGLMYAISGEGDDYLVDHSAALVLINPDGNIAAIFKPEEALGKLPVIDSDKLISDYQKIVALHSS